MALGSLRTVKWEKHLRAPDPQLVEKLYVPALERAVHYDRCCAYFCSSVLAAAARGFGGLVQNILKHGDKIPKPAVRLLVNEQLSQEDLDALLAKGDYDPLIKQLLKQFKTPANVLEKRRLEVLAWLVAHGWLEVRVGLMRSTGGILHAKFGVITDSRGNTLTFMGSGNETREGLLENYEELRIFTSWQEKEDAKYYQDRFVELWKNRDANLMTVSLPDAVRDKLIEIAPAEPPVREPSVTNDELKAAILWKYIAAAPFLPYGETACDATAPISLWPHQLKVVEDTTRSIPAGKLLCDEVGMGKTIEAIFVLRRLLAGRGVKRALLLVPAGLLQQWQSELREKGGLIVPIWDNGYLCYPGCKKKKVEAQNVFRQENVLIISREWARLERNRDILLDAPDWDLVMMDEAHAARRKAAKEGEFNVGNLLLELLRDLQLRRRARSFILLSATPMQTNPWEPWDLLCVLGIGGDWTAEFRDVRKYYGLVSQLRKGETPDSAFVDTACRLVKSDREFPKPPSGQIDGSLNLALLHAPKETRSKYADWLRRGAPLGRRMHRNTRQTLELYRNLGFSDYQTPTRDVQDVVFDYEDKAERDCYNYINRYIEKRFQQLEGERSGKGFVMTIYRRRATSSPWALRCSMERRRELCEKVIQKRYCSGEWSLEQEQLDSRDLSDVDIIEEEVDPALPATPEAAQEEKKEIENILKKLDKLGSTDSKFAKFKQVLDEVTKDGRPVLVFTEYKDTMEYLRDQLRPIYGQTLGCFSGDGGEVWDGKEWVQVSKADIAEKLGRHKLGILVCTDAASEGLNLQAASALINYDLPWNPSKVEQRIGRIDRIGQREKVLPIRNMFLNNSVDMRVYKALRDRCRLFEQFVGYMQPVLSLAREALRGNQTPDEFLRNLEKEIQEIDTDAVVSNTFIESDAEKLECSAIAILRRSDIENALEYLKQIGSGLTVKKPKRGNCWDLRLQKSRLLVSTCAEELERDPEGKVAPITALSPVVKQICESLEQQIGKRTPLVVAECSDGRFDAVEVRWVSDGKISPVKSYEELQSLVDNWDGEIPTSNLWNKAYQQAKTAAEARVRVMREQWEDKEKSGIHAQLEAARKRLLRELGRTLRCMGEDDLSILFNKQLQKENRKDGRFHRAKELLGDGEWWSDEEQKEINQFVQELKDNERKARTTFAEIDAALDDPRWQANIRYRY